MILGLLVGGVMTGQSLICAAQLRSVTTEYSRYVTAQQAFRDKYFSLPGDMTNAASFWAAAANGNGDGGISQAAAASAAGESFGYWEQLALAGFIEGSYTGIAGSGSVQHHVLGQNAPQSKFSSAGWSVYNYPIIAFNGGGWANFEGNYGNTLIFGTPAANTPTENSAIKAEEAWNIDTKLDDGRPGLGKIRAYETHTNCHDAGTSTTVALAGTANYRLTDTGTSCSLLFDM